MKRNIVLFLLAQNALRANSSKYHSREISDFFIFCLSNLYSEFFENTIKRS